MDNKNSHPILGRGELYVSDIEKKYYGGPKQYPHTYDESKQNLLNGLSHIKESIVNNSEIFLKEKVLCVRMEPKFEAKSYSPDILLSIDGISPIGGRKYSIEGKNGNQIKAKLYFAKATDNGIDNLTQILRLGIKDNITTWENQISAIRLIDLLSPKEKIAGFADDWETGMVEIVLHPLVCSSVDAIEKFLKLLNLPQDKYKINRYENGPTFCAAECTKNDLERISRFNPLRSIHPLGEINIPNLRQYRLSDAPKPSTIKGKSKTTVGVFDGGVDSMIPLLKGYVQNYNLTNIPPQPMLISHGTAVCGAVLYGALNYKKPNDELLQPLVSVESFRVLPQQMTGNRLHDLELYSVIDEIEDIVTKRTDIKLYNLSFGPRGPIIDDDINRFTYSLDKLTTLPHNPLFCIAAGNDGDYPKPFNRIQSPADIVNGLGIGAYTYNKDGNKIRASYSCIGPGREGCKVKPDLLEFGGSPENPILLVSEVYGKTVASCGTSFSSPIVAGKIGKIIASTNDIDPHMARTLLIHTASNFKDVDISEVGFGFCIEDIDNIINCSDNKVIVLYSGYIEPKQNIRMPVLLPNLDNIQNNAFITWTISTIVKPNPNDADSYTSNCIEDYFYPDSRQYSYTLKIDNHKKIIKARKGTQKEKVLLDLGYSRSDLPISKPPKQFLSEDNLRTKYLKWDTIVKKDCSLRASSLHDPFFILHGMSRDIFDQYTMKYYAAVTVEIPEYKGILYDEILNLYKNLTPIYIKNQNEILIQV